MKKKPWIPMWVPPEYVIMQWFGVLLIIPSLVVTIIWHGFWPLILISLVAVLIGSYPSIKDYASHLREVIKSK